MSDTRVTCIACRKYIAGECTDAVKAGLSLSRQHQAVGPQLAALPQHCPAYVARPVGTPAPPKRRP